MNEWKKTRDVVAMKQLPTYQIKTDVALVLCLAQSLETVSPIWRVEFVRISL